MANTKISALTSATTPLAGTETLPVVQSSATTKVAVSDLTAGRAVSALSYASTTGATFATTSGSVGIGTTLVPDKLSVLGNTTGVIGIRATNTNATGADKYIGMFAGGTSTGITSWNNSGVIESAVGTNLVLSGYNGTTLFQTGTSRTERMRITSTGDVGIGITPASPAKLEIKQSAVSQQGAWVYASANDSHARLFCDGASVGLAASFTSTGSYLPMKFYTSGLERMSISAAGDATVSTGNVVIGTSGKGIDFSVTSEATGMTSELLADYEEGTWTPAYSSTGATFTYAQQYGSYVKVGKLIYAQFYLNVTAAGVITNGATLTGLPYTSTSVNTPFEQGFGGAWSSNVLAIAFTVNPGATTVTLYRQNVTPATAATATNVVGYQVGTLIYRTV
jgi:hypothetical protein